MTLDCPPTLMTGLCLDLTTFPEAWTEAETTLTTTLTQGTTTMSTVTIWAPAMMVCKSFKGKWRPLDWQWIFLVSVHCKDTRIVVNVGTNKPFSGRIYALGRSETCNVDVINSDTFRLDLTMAGQDCNTQSAVWPVSRDIDGRWLMWHFRAEFTPTLLLFRDTASSWQRLTKSTR